MHAQIIRTDIHSIFSPCCGEWCIPGSVHEHHVGWTHT
jgi:hypothetical protein